MVHKTAMAEVFLTDAHRRGEHRFTVAAQWPRAHVFYRPGADGKCDPVLWLETVRQAGVYVAHRFYGVPISHQFVLAGAEFTIEDPQAPQYGATPHTVSLDVTLQPPAQDRRHFVVELEAVVRIDGRRCGRVAMRGQAVDTRRYSVLRRRNAPSSDSLTPFDRPAQVPLPPAAVGRQHEWDVVLAAWPDRADSWQLSLDPQHSVFFDHATDHLPGMALVEAFRQAVSLTGGQRSAPDHAPRVWALTSGEVSFEAFGELDAPVTVESRPAAEHAVGGDHFSVRADAVQGDRRLASATLTGRPLLVAGSRLHGRAA
ncbi:ScbA/BarX family gamma-butyrolactone biosynthesis protein [Kitasatospora sp. NPDC002040]|uniref:ScbA/BarX family gamma-butyrolactone biosynthesis protein n=1 Tax=Kitasatospora sp. NPDC002040 TaxID=3154661 RepID=UPI00332DD47E